MSNDWFRSWHGAPTDPKWLGIARKAGVVPGIVVAVAWALMDRASQSDDRGSIYGYDPDGLAYFFGCEPENIEAIVSAMMDKGIIDENEKFAAWEKRQPKREDGSSERAKAWRERKRNENNDTGTQENATERTRTQTNAREDTDTDTDTERKKEEDNPPLRVVRHPEPVHFEAGAIRLNRADYDRWVKAFPAINLEAELYSLSEWAGQQKSWFNAVSAALAKKDREARLARERIQAEAVANAGKAAKPNYLRGVI